MQVRLQSSLPFQEINSNVVGAETGRFLIN